MDNKLEDKMRKQTQIVLDVTLIYDDTNKGSEIIARHQLVIALSNLDCDDFTIRAIREIQEVKQK